MSIMFNAHCIVPIACRRIFYDVLLLYTADPILTERNTKHILFLKCSLVVYWRWIWSQILVGILQVDWAIPVGTRTPLSTQSTWELPTNLSKEIFYHLLKQSNRLSEDASFSMHNFQSVIMIDLASEDIMHHMLKGAWPDYFLTTRLPSSFLTFWYQ